MNWLAMVSGSMLLCAMAGCATGALSAASDGGQAGLRASALRCEYLDSPLGLGETAPRLSWVVESSRRGAKQSAYEVRVASTADRLAKGQADLWDSGKVKSAATAQIVYAGPPLTSRETCFWQVRSWDADNVPGPWSTTAQWEMGLLHSNDWHAKWIEAAPIAGVANGGPIHLLHASYETLDKKTAKDVTALVAPAVRGNTLAFKVQNDTLGGDPAYRKTKQLRIDYEQDGQRKSAVAGELETLSIPQQSLPYLRKGFEAKGEIRRARLYVTALGLYEISINGNRVGDHVLAPDWTDYDKRVQYQAYDVTNLLQRGPNAMGALVADGWYAGHIGNRGYRHWGQVPALCAQLEITYADGSVERVVTDGTWKAHSSPIVSSDFMLGENYDAGLAVAGWDQPGLDERDWSAVSTRDESARHLVAQSMQPVRVTGEIAAKTVTEPTPGHFVYDLGQNMVGVVRLKVRAPAGTKITVRHAEMLNPDGTLYTTNLRGAPSIDTYVLGGSGEHVCQPHFTFHGFRYVEVTGTDRLPPADVCGIVLGSDTPRTGEFACSDPRINQLQSNIQWGQRGNYLSVPTDCPQRDERLGWMGDAQVFVRTATFNSDVAAFFTKWLVDVDDAQTPDGRFADVSPDTMHNAGAPAWADAGVICPWTIYQVYGDPRVLERHLPAMTRWVEYCRDHSDGLLRDKDRGSDFGDWLSIGAKTPKDVIGTAYFAYSTHLLAKSYAAVGRSAEARKYQQLFDDICRAFTKAYVSADGRIKGDTQCVYAMALKFELLPEAMRPLAASHLVDDITAKHDHLSTGFVGVSYLLPVLTAADRTQTAYRLLMQDTFPSWLFSVKHGATTIWERWDGWTPEKGFQDPGMNSFNHYSLGSCGEWLFDSVAGIDQAKDSVGFDRVVIRPHVDGPLNSATATFASMHGPIVSAWKVADGAVTLDVTIPANATAEVHVPTSDPAKVTESGKAAVSADGVRFLRQAAGAAVYAVGSGQYHFRAPHAAAGSR